MPNSWALLVEVAVPSSSWVNARIAPPGLPFAASAMVALGQLGDPTTAATTMTTTKSTRARIGYFQNTWRTSRSGGRSLGRLAAFLDVSCGASLFSSMILQLFLCLG